ncbi:Protein CMSS1 [Triplophysa tibetana]|uniref:Protein CMSS1 n=1 Tax=Triplophysa tibetana TaxID=1572043 RepID=A0A5A9P0W3_9TELE|nr:Protein CMSS1 [Triplophysa tibetana]
MADDLGDEWWTHGDNSGPSETDEDTQPPTEEQQNKSTSKKRKSEKPTQENTKKKKKKETDQKECFITQERSEEKGDKESNTKKKRRKKKKTITDVLASAEPVPGSPADLRSLLKSHYSQTRSVIEQEELTLPDSCFLNINDLTHTLSSYLKEVCPKWAKIQKQHTETRSIVLLIVCGSALRTIDLIKQIGAFKGEAKVQKLFARHIKLDDHIKVLGKGVTHIGVGTPGRIAALLEKEGLTMQGMRYLIFDWNHRDQKQRRMVDITEVKTDLLKIMDLGLVQSCREGSAKIGLF